MSFPHSKNITITGSSVTYVGGNQINVAHASDERCIRQGLAGLGLDNTTSSEAATQTNMTSNPFPPSQPVPPEIFFGRDDLVSGYASLIVRNEQTRLAILGSGGIGKTSIALHVLHHQDIVNRYQDRRYFVGCDAISSAEALAALILQIIRVPSITGENIVTVLHRTLVSAPLTLLLLDNFETVWDINSSRDGIVDLLQKVVNAKRISLIITMRGAVPPLGIVWTHFGCLPQLSPPDAKRTILAINPSLSDSGHGDECLEKLLAEIDHVPLAVQLLAHVSIGFSPQYMLKRWTEKKTAMLRIREGKPGKLESVEVSIELSLATSDIEGNPEAVQLLGILCQLPDGLHGWEERLSIVGLRLHDVHNLAHLLHKTALIFIAGSSLKVLSPIRHFINHYHNPDLDHIRALEKYFWGVVHAHAKTPIGPDFPRAKEVLEPDLGNIRSLVKRAAQTHPSHELVEIVLEVSEFQYLTIPSTELLHDVMPLVKHVQSPTQEARILRCLGKILVGQGKYTEASESLKEAQRQSFDIGDVVGALYCSSSLAQVLRLQDKYTEAFETLTEARRQFIKIGNVLGAARCSHGLGDILYMQVKYPEAYETLTEAKRQFIEIGNDLGAALCSRSLGNILRMQDKYTEASDALTDARRQFIEIGDVGAAAQCSRSLGDILRMQDKYPEASETLTEARRQFIEIGYVIGAALCSRNLGDILRMQAKYLEASETLTEARRQFIEIGNIVGVAHCSRSLGDILSMQAKYPEASETLTEAQRQFIEIGNVVGAAHCSRSLGDILSMQAKYTEASETLIGARRQYIEVDDVLGAAYCSASLSNVFSMQAKYTEAFQTLTEAQSLFINIGNVCGTAQCSLYLGNIFYKQGRYTEASEALTGAQRAFLNIGVVLDANDCSRRLGDILVMQHKLPEAFDTLTEARQQFLDIGYPLGVTQCSQSLGKILFKQHKYTEASELLTEARRQFIAYDNAVSAAKCSSILDDIYRAQTRGQRRTARPMSRSRVSLLCHLGLGGL